MNSQSNSDTLKIFATNLLRLRKERGLTQEALAHMAGLDKSHIGYIEQLRHTPTLDTATNIAKALNVPISELFNLQAGETGDDIELARLNALLPHVRRYQELADEYGIDDVFQDNGGKLLQTLILTGLQNMSGREGNDAVDNQGQEWELKTVNAKKVKSFSTHHHLTVEILAKYRKAKWLFSVYEGIEVVEIWIVEPDQLEGFFTKCEQSLSNKQKSMSSGLAHINNPKIPLKDVRLFGKLYYRDRQDDKIRPTQKLASFKNKYSK
ncbi:helix-turn-helix domain-containing protein [Fibrella sp. WM1]|uniref:helix-turn-helix domain-containing protein n=1 Tax=Fibrella musci TaxID=3242485 RepID=UPI003520A288